MVEVIVLRGAVEDFDRLASAERASVLNALDRLATWPAVSGVKALQGVPGYRIRCGGLRILFEVLDGVPHVKRIGARDDVYEFRKQHRQGKQGG